MKKYFSLIFGISLLTSCSTTYRGVIISAKDSSPVKGAEIILNNTHCLPSVIVKTISNEHGEFKLKIPFSIKKCSGDSISIDVLYNNNRVTHQLNKTEEKIILKL